MAAGRAVEGGVTEGEDAAVGGDEPVALAVGRGRHADDRLVEGDGTGRAVEGGVTKGEDAAIGSDKPVALPVLRRGDGDDGVVERPADGAERTSRAEVPHRPLRTGEPVVVRGDAGQRGHARAVDAPAATSAVRCETDNQCGDQRRAPVTAARHPGQGGTDRRGAPAAAEPLLHMHVRRIVVCPRVLERCTRGEDGRVAGGLIAEDLTPRPQRSLVQPEPSERGAKSDRRLFAVPLKWWFRNEMATTVCAAGARVDRGDRDECTQAGGRDFVVGRAGAGSHGGTCRRRSSRCSCTQGHREHSIVGRRGR